MIVSNLAGTSFLPVLGDDGVKAASAVKRIIFVCGKHFYALHKHREAQVRNGIIWTGPYVYTRWLVSIE